MEICTDKHDEIVHDERKCPLCEAIDNINDLEKEKKELEERICELENEIETLNDIKESMIIIN